MRLYKFSPESVEFWFCSDLGGVFHQACKGKLGKLGKMYSHTSGFLLSHSFKANREFSRLKKDGYVQVSQDRFRSIFASYDSAKKLDIPECELPDLSDRLYDVLFWSGCAIGHEVTNKATIKQIEFRVIDIEIAKVCLKKEFSFVGFSAEDYKIWTVLETP